MSLAARQIWLSQSMASVANAKSINLDIITIYPLVFVYYLVDHAKPNFSKPQRDDSGCLS